MKIDIRESDYRADLPRVAELFSEYATYIGIDLTFQGFTEELASLPGYYAPPEGRIYFATVDGQPAGILALRKIAGHDGELKRLYVKPEYRGMGLAKRLTDLVIAEAAAIGYTALYLDTLSSMKAAIALYQSLGFTPVPAYYDNPLPDVVYFKREIRD